MVRVVAVSRVDEVLEAGHLFDTPPRERGAEEFLDRAGHHLLLAFLPEQDAAVGFVTGVEMIHPDKGTEMFLYELGVDDAARGRGVGAALVDALAELAKSRGCYGMWTLTDADNEAAMRTYRRGGASAVSEHAMPVWEW